MKKINAKILILKRIGQILWFPLRNLNNLKSGPVYWRMVMEDLGGGFIKLAQIMALRYEILPPRYCKEFSNLFDRVAPFSKEEVQLVFQAEFGKNPEEIFQEFSYEPHATASFGEVHVGLLNNQKLAIKVQKPDIQIRVNADIAIIKFMAALVGIFMAAPINIKDAIRELEVWTRQELDYRIEAQNALRFRNDKPGPFYIPKVFTELSTSRILVAEFLDGWNLNDIVYRNVINLSPEAKEKIAHGIVHEHLLDYFRGGFFHADPHLGNIMVLKDGRLGYVDFGIMGGYGDLEQNYHFANFIKFSAERSSKEAIKHFKEVMESVAFRRELMKGVNYSWHNKSPAKIEKGIARFLEHKLGSIIKEWAEEVGKTENDFYTRSTARHFISLIALARRYGMELPTNLLSFIRATVIADMVCLILDPKFNMQEDLRLFFVKYPELCMPPLKSTALPSKISVASVSDERKAEQELEEKQRFVERYLTHAERILERIIEEGTRGLAYFTTTKV